MKIPRILLGFSLAILLVGCGLHVPPSWTDCRTWGCGAGQVCEPPFKPTGGQEIWSCQAEPEPTPTPSPTPAPTPSPTPSPTPTPACSLGTPSYKVATNPSWGISRYGRGYQATPKARFGKAYYCTKEMNWPEACAAGRVEGPVAPDGHPQRRACEAQFLESPECPIVTMGRCTGLGNQCPVTFDAWIWDETLQKEVPHNINRGAGCSEEGMLPQNGERIRAMWAQPSGKGTLKFCFDNGICTESPEFDQ